MEIRRGSESGLTGERLPWLEPVEDEDDGGYGGPNDEPGGGYGGVVAAALAVLVLIAAITAGIAWFRHHRAATADIGEVIHPDPGPYKVKPADSGGLNTSATGEVAAGTSAGQDIDSVLDLNKVPEAPMVKREAVAQAPALQPVPAKPQAAPAQPTPQHAAPSPVKAAEAPPAPAPKPVAPPKPKIERVVVAPTPTAPVSTGGGAGGTVQLGAFSSEAKAKAAWKTLSGRFAMLKDMTPTITPVDSGDSKLFRLRASGGTVPTGKICAQMRVGGDTCSVVGQ